MPSESGVEGRGAENSGIRTQDFFAWSLDAVSQHRRSAQALIGLGTGRSPSSSGCSPSAQALLSRAQSRSSTLSSEPNMPFLTRTSYRGPLVKFRQRFSRCPGRTFTIHHHSSIPITIYHHLSYLPQTLVVSYMFQGNRCNLPLIRRGTSEAFR